MKKLIATLALLCGCATSAQDTKVANALGTAIPIEKAACAFLATPSLDPAFVGPLCNFAVDEQQALEDLLRSKAAQLAEAGK